ncbi:hypothetical protein N7451_005540 [Penicillium sp. IBT 35674x]|nr:hypothetical protein N7451_005540 [Penicillium sp. IBT 35674x]
MAYSWCKRPCSSDEYFQTFNKPNVTLIDTKGKGITAMTVKSIMASEIEHELDVIVFCTGYRLATAVVHGKIIVTLGDNQSLHKIGARRHIKSSRSHEWRGSKPVLLRAVAGIDQCQLPIYA